MELIYMKALLLVTIIAFGYFLKRIRILATSDARILSKIIIYFTLPAALISGFQTFTFDPEFLILIPLALTTNLIMLFLGLYLTRYQSDDIRALYAFQLSSYNIGAFVLPFVQSFFPPQGLVATSLFDAGNCPINCGISFSVVESATSKNKISWVAALLHLLKSPPFMTYTLMLLLSVASIKLPVWFFQLADKIGASNMLLAMLMIGILLEPNIPKPFRKQVFQILGIRYGSNILFALAIWFLPIQLILRQVAILSVLAPIPSMALIYSKKFGCNDATCGLLSSLSLIISLPLAFLLLILWGL